VSWNATVGSVHQSYKRACVGCFAVLTTMWYRYIPVGLLERPQTISERPPAYVRVGLLRGIAFRLGAWFTVFVHTVVLQRGRDDLETLMNSHLVQAVAKCALDGLFPCLTGVGGAAAGRRLDQDLRDAAGPGPRVLPFCSQTQSQLVRRARAHRGSQERGSLAAMAQNERKGRGGWRRSLRVNVTPNQHTSLNVGCCFCSLRRVSLVGQQTTPSWCNLGLGSPPPKPHHN